MLLFNPLSVQPCNSLNEGGEGRYIFFRIFSYYCVVFNKYLYLDWRCGKGGLLHRGQQLAGPVLSTLNRLRPRQVSGRGGFEDGWRSEG